MSYRDRFVKNLLKLPKRFGKSIRDYFCPIAIDLRNPLRVVMLFVAIAAIREVFHQLLRSLALLPLNLPAIHQRIDVIL